MILKPVGVIVVVLAFGGAALSGCGGKARSKSDAPANADTVIVGQSDSPVAAATIAPPPPPRGTATQPASPPAPTLRTQRQWTIEETTIDALGRIGKPAVEALVRALHDPDPRMRERAARVLARVGADAQQAVPDLMAALSDKDEDVRKAAIRALGQIGPAAAEAVPALMEQLRSSLPESDTPNKPGPSANKSTR